MTAELRIEATTENLGEVIDFVTGTLTEACTPRERMHLEVVTEEIFVNIASYAYPEGTGYVTVLREGGEGPEGLTLVFEDSGVPFDPLAAPDPDLTAPAEERPIGGLGVFLVKQFVDEAKYAYRDGKNILTVRKRIVGKKDGGNREQAKTEL